MADLIRNQNMNWTGDEFDPGMAFDTLFSGPGLTSELEAIRASNGMYGNPEVDAAAYVGQTTPFTCAVVSQQMILQQFGIEVGEAQLVYDATAHGWLSDTGTAPEDVGRLLEHYGVQTHTHVGGGVEDLIAELARGHKVIAAVDSGELSGSDWVFEDWLRPNGADHALVVTGVDVSDPANPRVFVNDPGHPDGAGRAYPLDQFLDAWNDSGRYFVATDDAPPDLADHPVLGAGFDPAEGLYLGKEFWTDLALRVAGAVAAAAVGALLDRALDADTVGDVPMRTVEHFTDSQRDQLFYRI